MAGATHVVLRGARILIHEPYHTGHRLTGVRVLLEALLALGRAHAGTIGSITLSTSEAAHASAEFATQLAPLGDAFDVRVDAPGAWLGARRERVPAFRSALERLRSLDAVLAGGDFDHAYVPYGDGLIQLLALRRLATRRVPWPIDTEVETIMMRAGFAYPGTRSAIRRLGLLGLAHAPFARVHLIDPFAWHRLALERPALLARTALLPDPITPTPPRDRRAARRALGLPETGRFVGCVGQIDRRKGADLLIEAFRHATLGADDRLLLAGMQSDAVRDLLARTADPRIVVMDRYLAEEELVDAMAALDLVATPYPDFTGSASIVIRAAAAARPCLVNDAGWMGYVVPRFALGDVCDVHDREAFALALVRALDAAPSHSPGEATARFVDYGRTDNIRAHWTAGLRRRLGLGADPTLRPWPDPALPA